MKIAINKNCHKQQKDFSTETFRKQKNNRKKLNNKKINMGNFTKGKVICAFGFHN